MKTSIQTLPGIKAIGWIDCRQLQQRVDLAAICGMQVVVLTEIHPIAFFDKPTCECSTKKEGGSYQDTATLRFLTDSRIPDNGALGFVVTDVSDKSYLIGSRERPLPVVESTRKLGLPSGEAAGFAYEVRHVALRSMIPCII